MKAKEIIAMCGSLTPYVGFTGRRDFIKQIRNNFACSYGVASRVAEHFGF